MGIGEEVRGEKRRWQRVGKEKGEKESRRREGKRGD